jgi:hypothetical protein
MGRRSRPASKPELRMKVGAAAIAIARYIAVLKRGEVWGRVLCLCPMPYALCPMPYALCPMPYKHLMLLRKAIFDIC